MWAKRSPETPGQNRSDWRVLHFSRSPHAVNSSVGPTPTGPSGGPASFSSNGVYALSDLSGRGFCAHFTDVRGKEPVEQGSHVRVSVDEDKARSSTSYGGFAFRLKLASALPSDAAVVNTKHYLFPSLIPAFANRRNACSFEEWDDHAHSRLMGATWVDSGTTLDSSPRLASAVSDSSSCT